MCSLRDIETVTSRRPQYFQGHDLLFWTATVGGVVVVVVAVVVAFLVVIVVIVVVVVVVVVIVTDVPSMIVLISN